MNDKQQPQDVEITGDGNVIGDDNVSQVVRVGSGSAIHSIVQVAGDYYERDRHPDTMPMLFLVPFLRNPAFVGRNTDLVALYELLHSATSVGIRPDSPKAFHLCTNDVRHS